MVALVADPIYAARLIQERKDRGIDHHDEIWDGVYVMAPAPNNEHQYLVSRLTYILNILIDSQNSGIVLPGTNITDRTIDWRNNFRCPDVVYFSSNSPAIDKGTHWLGGPDLAIEIVSLHDRTREKLEFYESVGTRELLIVDREPWQLELYRFQDGKLSITATSSLAEPTWVAFEALPLRLRLQGEKPGERPAIEIAHLSTDQTWRI